MKKIGIYKILSPSNKVYIGQSIDIFTRLKRYRQLTCKNQHRLYHSLVKHGYDKHIISIIEECDIDSLNERERYWQEFYDVLNKHKGLNCHYTETNEKHKVHSKETIDKISIGNKGKRRSEEEKIKMSERMKGRFIGDKHPNFGKKASSERIEIMRINSTGNKNMLGKKHSEETKKKLSLIFKGCKHTEEARQKIIKSLIGRKLSEKTRAKISKTNTGKKRSEETKINISNSLKGRKLSEECLKKRSITLNSRPSPTGRMVLNIETGIYYDSIIEASIAYGINHRTLQNRFSRDKNKGSIIYA